MHLFVHGVTGCSGLHCVPPLSYNSMSFLSAVSFGHTLNQRLSLHSYSHTYQSYSRAGRPKSPCLLSFLLKSSKSRTSQSLARISPAVSVYKTSERSPLKLGSSNVGLPCLAALLVWVLPASPHGVARTTHALSVATSFSLLNHDRILSMAS